MGVDVMLFARGIVSDAELLAAKKFISSRVHLDDYTTKEGVLTRSDYLPDLVVYHSLDRYYGPGYERGWWPEIYNVIVVMRSALPNCTIHYGSDSDDYQDIEETTEEDLDQMWDYWLSPDGLNYRNWSL